MVVIHLKGDGENMYKEQCLVDTTGDVKCGELTLQLTTLQNTRVRLRFMIAAAKFLQKNLADDGLKKTFEGPIAAATDLLSLDHVANRRKVTLAEYLAAADALKGCAIIAYPAACSDSRGGRTPVENLCAQLESEECEDLDHVRSLLSLLDDGARTEDMLPEGATQLWWASKQLHAEDLLSKYSGKNDKTKLVCKITKVGSHAPTKEPPIDAKTQQDMMTYWHRKQEENKKLVADEDISYGNAQWADPKGLKNQFQGTGNISWRPKLG
ncbi:UPF0769 protein [Diplonema papillatum]|nr:UPF0769 protein [Diplonema papillatum]KAJ9440879.1 UPF0769 protein [Diplonema papillatum]|eukprot:gene19640-30264_t